MSNQIRHILAKEKHPDWVGSRSSLFPCARPSFAYWEVRHIENVYRRKLRAHTQLFFAREDSARAIARWPSSVHDPPLQMPPVSQTMFSDLGSGGLSFGAALAEAPCEISGFGPMALLWRHTDIYRS